MKFVLRMAARELRASWKRLLFFFVSIAVGVGSMIALGSLVESVRSALMRESKGITAADLLIWADRPYTDNARSANLARKLGMDRVGAQWDEDHGLEVIWTVEGWGTA